MKILNKNNNKLFYIDSGSGNAKMLLKSALSFLFNKNEDYYSDLIVLCIGSDRATGDCLGPLCGHKIENNIFEYNNFKLFGTLNNPVHAKNLEEVVEKIHSTHETPFIIAVDACLGKSKHVGYITVSNRALNPGSALNQNLPSVGNISITGIVNDYEDLDIKIISNTRLNIVMQLADIIAEGIMEVFNP